MKRNSTPEVHRYTGPCPLCGGTKRFLASSPSSQYPRGGFCCRSVNGCGQHGNLVQLLMKLEKCDEKAACEKLGIPYKGPLTQVEKRQFAISKKYGIDMPSSSASKPAPEKKNVDMASWRAGLELLMQGFEGSMSNMPYLARNYLSAHGMTEELVTTYGFRYNFQPKQVESSQFSLENQKDIYVPAGLAIPLKDAKGVLFGIKLRLFSGNNKYYELSMGKRPCVYARPLRPGLPMLAVESENDVYMLDARIGDAVNVFSAGGADKTFDADTDKAVRQCPWFIIAYDADGAGITHGKRVQDLYPGSHIARIPGCFKDPSESLGIYPDLKMWILSNMPPVLRKRAMVKLKVAYDDHVLAPMEKYWKLHHAFNTGQVFPVISTQEELAEKLSGMPLGTCVAISMPPTGPWSIAFQYETYALDAAAALGGEFCLGTFDLKFVVKDPYACQKELCKLHLENKPVGSVQAYDQYELLAETRQRRKRTYFPNMQTAHGLRTSYSFLDKHHVPQIRDFIHKIEEARPYVANPDGMPYDREKYRETITAWQNKANMKSPTTQYRNADTAGKGTIPVNYTAFGTVTGRYTTQEPNSQGISREMRKAFSAPEGCSYISIDFHMVQPRIIAAKCGDEVFRSPFLNGQDYYKYWIRKVLGFDGEITKSMRNFFKTPSLALLYGMGKGKFTEELSKKLAGALPAEIADLGLDEAKIGSMYESFWNVFPDLARWDASVKQQAGKTGFARTLSGRPIPLEIKDGKYLTHTATCYFAQGTEVEIMLDAVIAFGRQVSEKGLSAKIALCLHDELLILCPNDEVDQTEQLAKAALTNAFASRFPEENTDQLLEVSHAHCWSDLK